MDPSTVSVLWYRRSKPQGKVRRRVQDLRIPSSSYPDFRTSRPMLDLSHNESARLAVDSLLSQGLEEYHEVLNAEGEVDFLSDPEKIYLLENGKDGSAAVPGASDDDDDDDDDKESLSAGSQSDTLCPVMSTESDPTMEGLDQSSLKVAKRTDHVLDEPNVKVYFQHGGRAAGMKDLVREFIRKATMALALVTDCFSDVELLCDLLEASRKRNVSVHLLLDHLNLNLFVSMWQELKLNGKNFPKLSVHSVNGQTYCAKTGRKLTGQIAESFIINDWTEVLTGSYSFSWLSWQVHRSLAVLVKAGAVIPFHQEFHRLYSSAKPVPGFVSYITVPHTLPAFHAAHNHNTDGSESSSSHSKTMRGAQKDGTQTKAKTSVLSDPQSSELERSRGTARPLHRAGTQHDGQTAVKALEKIQIQSHPNPIGQIHVSFVQPQLTTTPAAERSARVRESNPLHLPLTSPAHAQHRTVHYQLTFKTNSNLEHRNVGTEGLFFQQRNREGLTTPTGLITQRRPWNYSPNIKPKVDFCSDNPRVPSPSTPQPKQANAGMWFPPSDARGQPSGPQTNVSSQETRRQDQAQRYHQPALHSLPTTEAQDPKPASAATGTQRVRTQLQSDSKLLSPGTGAKQHLQPCTSQQAKHPPRLNWMHQSQDARLRPFSATYGTGQKADGQLSWRPLDRSMNTSLGRSKSMNDRHLQASTHT